jgi:hypothetical protein
MYKGQTRECNVVLEVVADYDRWIWPVFFGIAKSQNDINLLQRSLVFGRIAEDHAPAINYEINGHTYNKGSYLAYVIYPP